MNHQVIAANLTAITLALIIFVPTLLVIADASYDRFDPDVYDLSIDLVEFTETHDIYNYLVKEGWINPDKVDYAQFDYIFVLTNQLCTMSRNSRLPLIIAMIAVESRFDVYDEYAGAYGLCQLLPIYHSARMQKFVEEGHLIDLDDFLDPRLNIATAIDYMDDILDEVKGDEAYALMYYNQGFVSARHDHISNGITSSYAGQILELADTIERMLITYYDKEG